jgi:hypothetical protein
MGFWTATLMLFAFSTSVWAEDVALICTSPATSANLYINLDFPEASDDCDISYNDDCGRIVGRYTLNADLAHPLQPVEAERFIDSFDEAFVDDLEIRQDEVFTIRFSRNYFNEITQLKTTVVTVESHVVTEEPSEFSLQCRIP